MKKIFVFALIIMLGFSASATTILMGKAPLKKTSESSEQGITFFHGTWQEALTKAKEENKLIFLDAMASWCGPCKLMAKNTFTDHAVGAYFNENFINVKMDMERHPEGPRLDKKFALVSYPTLYFINSAEEKVYEKSGYLKPNQLISQGKKALKKIAD